MIPYDFIVAWRQQAPWIENSQVEQDLILSRALVEIFRDGQLRNALAFRGGTALYKLHLTPAARYSEDIDLVQVKPEPIGTTLDALRASLDSWLGTPKRVFKDGRVTLLYRFASEDSPPLPLRLKVEINSREHFSVLGLRPSLFQVDSRWFSGTAEIQTFALDELLGTKLRALYQRKKGRDLFDLWWAAKHADINFDRVVQCFQAYLAHSGLRVSRAELEANLIYKLRGGSFAKDVEPLLVSGADWDPADAARLVAEEIAPRLPGDPWQEID